MELKICSKCKIEKEVCNFYIVKKPLLQYRARCKKCTIKEDKIYQENNKESILKRSKIYRENNKEIIEKKRIEYYKSNPEKYNERKKYFEEHRKKNLKYYRDYHKNRIKNDVNFRLIKILRSRLNKFIHNNNNLTKTSKTIEFLGCSVLELKNHLGHQFTEGMSWDNYGYYGWHIDHITPLSLAKTEEELYILCHHSNLQPLWAKDNISKGNKIL